MRQPTIILLAVLAAVGSWVFFNGLPVDQIPQPSASWWKGKADSSDAVAPVLSPSAHRQMTLRVATFNLGQFGPSKTAKPHVMDILAHIIRQYDVVACQGIRSRDRGALPGLVDHANSPGRKYDYLIGPRVGDVEQSREQFAFVFDTETVLADRQQVYTVDDPDDLIAREPFVGWFQARGPSADEAFTFTLVNLHVTGERAERELELVDGILRAVRNDGRDEDDVLVLGTFSASSRKLDAIIPQSDLVWALAGAMPTNVSGTHQFDNIGFTSSFTDEFLGRAGAMDFLRELNLTSEVAAEVSNDLPVWAEFSVYEGGSPRRMAARP